MEKPKEPGFGIDFDRSPSGRITNLRTFTISPEDIEKRTMEDVVDRLLAAEYVLSIFDGRYETVTRSTVRDVILAGMRTTVTDRVLAYRGDRKDAVGFVFVEYNGGLSSVQPSDSLAAVFANVDPDPDPE